MATDLCKQLRKVLSAKAQEQKALQEANTAIQSYTEQYDPRTQRMPNYATALITAQKAKQVGFYSVLASWGRVVSFQNSCTSGTLMSHDEFPPLFP